MNPWKKVLSACIIGCFVLSVHAQTPSITITGNVQSTSGKPISGAQLTLKNAGIRAFTDSLGNYTISNTAVVTPFSRSRATFSPEIQGRQISFGVDKSGMVSISIFDLSGALVRSVVQNQPCVAGNYRVTLDDKGLARKLYLINVQLGAKQTVLRYMPSNLTSGASQGIGAPGSGALAKQQSAADFQDSLTCQYNYVTSTIPVTDPSGVYNFSLTTSWPQGYYLWAYGDDSLDLYVNGTLVGHGQPQLYPADSLTIGSNTIAAMVRNGLFGGAFMCVLVQQFIQSDSSITYTQVGNIQTDSTWKYSFLSPTGWQNAGFNDGAWTNAVSYGGGLVARQGFHNIDSSMTAQWIYTSRTLYFRKTFTSAAGGKGILRLCSNEHITAGAIVDLFLNGTELVSPAQMPVSGFVACTTSFAAGPNLVAIQLQDTTHGDGSQFVCDIKVGPDTIRSDSSWKCSDMFSTGWNALSFNDAAWYSAGVEGSCNLASTGIKIQWTAFPKLFSDSGMVDTVLKDTTFVHEYDSLMGDSIRVPSSIDSIDTIIKALRLSKAEWIYGPNDVYLRHTFTFSGLPTANQNVLTDPKLPFLGKKK